jgi:hypothetical protein
MTATHERAHDAFDIVETLLQAEADGHYRYEPLRTSGEIRLLTIEQGLVDGRIACHLAHASIKSEYIAISYVWGSNHLTHSVLIDGRPLNVTANCEALLSVLRSQDLCHCFWIDALCIDQENPLERRDQVVQMGEIFAGAWRTIVYLGEHDADSAIVLPHWDGDRTLSLRASFFGPTEPLYPDTGLGTPELHNDPTSWQFVRPLSVRSMERFQARPWFRRTWVIQEVLLSKKVVFLLSNDTRQRVQSRGNFFPMLALLGIWRKWRKLSNPNLPNLGIIIGCHDYESRINPKSEAPTVFQLMAILRDEAVNRSQTKYRREIALWRLFSVLERTREFECSDPRDKLFAVASLFSRPLPILLRPDYEKTVGQTFTDAMWFMIDYGTSAAIMAAGRPESRSADNVHLPSWVIDWCQPRYTSNIGSTWHAGYSERQKQIVAKRQDEVLVIRGLLAGEIHSLVNEPPDIPSSQRSEQRQFRNILSLLVDDCLELERDTFLAALCTDGNIQAIAPDFEPTRTKDLEEVARQCNNRRLLHLISGQLAIGPEGTQPGDCVCVFLGVETPMLIRPLDDYSWHLVGQCFVQGVMHGEAVSRVNWETVLDDVPKAPLWDFRIV